MRHSMRASSVRKQYTLPAWLEWRMWLWPGSWECFQAGGGKFHIWWAGKL